VNGVDDVESLAGRVDRLGRDLRLGKLGYPGLARNLGDWTGGEERGAGEQRDEC
jgi:hypothetical protein